MDQIDLDIITLLQHDGRMAYTEVAKTLNISEGTVRNRVSRLMDKGVLQIVGLVNPNQLGYEAPAMIGVNIQPPNLIKAAEIIAAFPEVSYLIMVSGEFDLFVEVFCRDRSHLAEFLNEKLLQVPGIERVQSFITLQTFKMASGAVPTIRFNDKLE